MSIIAKKTMESSTIVNHNSVYGDLHHSGITSLGRVDHVKQVALDRHQTTASTTNKRIANWNVRTMLHKGKLGNVKQEMERMNINILGMSEVRWKGSGSTLYDGYRILYSGGEEHERGVGFVLDSETAKTVKGYWPISDRVILLKLQGKPFDIGIVQVYAPTSTHSDEEVEEFYELIEKALKQLKSQDVKIIMGDLNAKVGDSRINSIVGPYGLGEINERGERLVEFCREHDFVISNTWFSNHKRRRWTWMSPGDRTRNQIDYFLIQSRFRNSVKFSKSMPGADCDSDHVPVLTSIKVKLKRTKKSKALPKYHTDFLFVDSDLREKYCISVQNKFRELSCLSDKEDNFERLKQSIIEAQEEIVPVAKKKPHKRWMTPEILELMEKRRKQKYCPSYTEINREIKRKCNEAKEHWLNKKCETIEIANHMKSTQEIHSEIKEICGKTTCTSTGCIKAKDGTLLIDRELVLNRWSEYIEELFHDQRGEKPKIEKAIDGPPILKEEVKDAMKKMRRGRAVGPDNVSTELMDALGDWGIDRLTEIMNKIYDSGEIPNDMSKSIFIMLPKKPGANECGLHRTISLMSHLTKILLKILLARMGSKIRSEIGRQQFGFMPNTGTRNATLTLSMIIERSLEMQKDVFICFIDYAKAFDKVRHEKLMDYLQCLDLDGKDLRILRNIYWEQTAATRIDGEISEFKEIQRGVRQGCVISPILFNIYSEMIFREIDDHEGIIIGGQNFNNLRYADDSALIADSEEKLQNLLTTIARKSEEMGLELNVNKTECMVMSRKSNIPCCNINHNGQPIRQVNRFTYLGLMLTSDGTSTSEIKKRIGLAKDSFNRLKPILQNRNLKIGTKIKILQTYVWSMLMFGCECWKITKDIERKIEAAEMWFLRRMLNIQWKDKISNEDVLLRSGIKRTLLNTIRKRQLSFFGHVYRKDGVERLVITGKISGKKSRGRPRTAYVDSLRKVTELEMTNTQFMRKADDRQCWRTMVADVCNRPSTR